MELIKGYIKTIKVPIPATATSLSAKITNADGDVVVSNVSISQTGSVAELLIPYGAVEKERDLELHIKFTVDGTEYDRKIKMSVTTPYLELFELEQILESEDEDECWKVEAAVRHIINSHCGQQFGLTEEAQTIVGNTESIIGTNRPILKVSRITEDGVDVYDVDVPRGNNSFLGKGDYKIVGDGWYIKRPDWKVDSIKADRGNYYSSDPIKTPRFFSDNSFINDAEYIIRGEFGYDSVPDPIREAAKLLVNDYACGDNAYRDRYLKSISAADWTLGFAAGAWKATGNARADKLLAPFVVNRIVVV